jgi:hypothetical protein
MVDQLWIVYSGWEGTGKEAVIVTAPTEDEAIQQASDVLIRRAEADLGPKPKPYKLVHHAEQMETYRTRWLYRCQPITLPFVTEITR